MSNEWTAERLEALPEDTVIEWTELSGSRICCGVRSAHERWDWLEASPTGGRYSSESLLHYADCESIRVVSVPIDALLADETARAIARAMSDDWNPDRDPVLTAMFQDYAQTAARAAVDHVIGGKP